MKLYYHEISSNARKACAVAKHLALDVDYVAVDLTKGEHKTPEFLAINPNGKLPALIDNGKVLWESNAIMCHLADKAGSDLWPKDERQIDIVRWFCWEQAHFTRHAGTLFFENFIKPAMGRDDINAEAVREATEFLHRFAGVLDVHLEGRDYLVGNALTVADFAVGVVVPLAATGKVPLDGYAEIGRWQAALNELPAWREPFPEKVASAA
ncbi:MAG: glutathione S-transferase family protein [Inquilinus sp.]|nr:glutathione S-transferase family protein [Inquilinus sp.]